MFSAIRRKHPETSGPASGQSHKGMVDSSGKAVDYSFEGVGIPSTDLSFAS